MDMLRKMKKDWFYSFNMIFAQRLNAYGKLIYVYLCRCADSVGTSFPSYGNIMLNCSVRSRATVSKALKDLEFLGLLKKEKRFSQTGGQTSNLYTIYDTPCLSNELAPVHLMDAPSSPGKHPHVHPVNYPSSLDEQEVRSTEVRSTEVRSSGGKNDGKAVEGLSAAPPPAPKEIVLGDFKKVKLKKEQYGLLIKQYGKEKAADYIARLDQHIASSGKSYVNHYATIIKWINEDERKDKPNQHNNTNFNKNANFKGNANNKSKANFQQRDLDMEMIKKIEDFEMQECLTPQQKTPKDYTETA